MTKDQTKCNSGEGKGVDGAAMDEVRLLTPEGNENIVHLADACGLDLSVTPVGHEFMLKVKNRRTGKVMHFSRDAKKLRGYIIAYSEGRDAGIAEFTHRLFESVIEKTFGIGDSTS